MSQKYFGIWDNAADVAMDFSDSRYAATPATRFDGFPREDEILFAWYEIDGYEGSAFVLFERDQQLYEVHGSHCSCYGLEGQWKPEETTWEALRMREVYLLNGSDAHQALLTLIKTRQYPQ